MIEYSLVMRDSLSVSSSVRVGARIAATSAGAGEVSATECPTTTGACRIGDPNLVVAAAVAIAQAGTAMPKNAIDEVWVYQANNSGYPTNAEPLSSTTYNNNALGATDAATAFANVNGCAHACIRYVWSDTFGRFVYGGGSWDTSLINACINDVKAQSVGVYMKATHPFITRLFGLNFPLQDHTVMMFEPLPSNQCLPTKHQ
jgi:hypothetical protein